MRCPVSLPATCAMLIDAETDLTTNTHPGMSMVHGEKRGRVDGCGVALSRRSPLLGPL